MLPPVSHWVRVFPLIGLWLRIFPHLSLLTRFPAMATVYRTSIGYMFSRSLQPETSFPAIFRAYLLTACFPALANVDVFVYLLRFLIFIDSVVTWILSFANLFAKTSLYM